MANVHDESSSDVARARALSRRLSATDEAVDRRAKAPVAPPANGYVRFDASRFAAEANSLAAARKEGPMAAPAPGGGDWVTLLDWARQRTGGDVAFLGDASGLLVASSGELPRDRAEAMGARLALSFENADAMEGDAQRSRFLVVDFGGSVVSGLRIEHTDAEALVLGIAGPTPLDAQARSEIHRAFADKART